MPAPRDTRLFQAIATLQQNLSKRFHAPELARAAGLSIRYFHHGFKQEVGMTFVEFYRKLRMARAREILAGTSQSVKAIALDLGYRRVEVFDREFRQYHSCTPTEYRSRCQKNQ
ncbi:MAG: helix-turn-helix transcriptional regulator [Acidobacteria bacterium]|nr:helix-turn-helix transcriptional regulator [Acidobacteriota bacterium]